MLFHDWLKRSRAYVAARITAERDNFITSKKLESLCSAAYVAGLDRGRNERERQNER